ncbi:MAG: prephenate dehydrogenase/arogenate dehydrogenase family protein [Candidatus Marinimicrobia bacterium]|nr:prephenate dehydrogenase/arogenate dehydrogenase family protein [Candidatus Neomarinimicrobiota bacterium]
MLKKSTKNTSFAVIGYGRFGKLWAEILSSRGNVYVYEKDPKIAASSLPDVQFTDLYTALKQDVIFLCIPISAIQDFLRDHASRISPDATVIDTASVKSMPVSWMDIHIPGIKHLGVHPLFGPDSYDSNQINLMIITASEQYPDLAGQWDEIFTSWHFHTKILTSDAHDKSIAYSQGITHFIGNVLEKMGLPETDTPTRGYKDAPGCCKVLQQ